MAYMPSESERQPSQPPNQEVLGNLVNQVLERYLDRQLAENERGIIDQAVSRLLPEAREEAARLARERMGEMPSLQLPEGGLGALVFQNVDVGQIQNSTLQAAIQGIGERIGDTSFDVFGPERARDFEKELDDIREQAEAVEEPGIDQINQMIQNLNQAEQGRKALDIERGRGREYGSVSLYLTPQEIGEMSRSLKTARFVLERWVSQIESRDHIYAHEHENQGLYQKYQVAIAWLPSLDFTKDPDVKEKTDSVLAILREYRTRIALHNMRRALSTTDWQAVMGEAVSMGSASLFEGFRIKHAEVAFNLYQQYFERYRFRYGTTTEVYDLKKRDYVKFEDLKKEGIEKKPITGVALDRITPESVNEIRRQVEDELVKNWELYGFESEEEAQTASRIGFNVFRASQRMGVHTARGRTIRAAMEGVEGYRSLRKEGAFASDPEELLVNLYNPWQFQIEKWTRYGPPQYAIYEKILDMLGNGKRDVGQREMVDILKIVDYFSSGWRLKEILEALERRMRLTGNEWEQRKDSLATGFQLQIALGKLGKEAEAEKEKAIKNVAKYRPLELAKAYAVTIDEKGNDYTTGKRQDEFQAMLKDEGFNVGSIVIDNSVKLEEVLGRYIYPIYNQMMLKDWDEIRNIDIGKAGHDPANCFDRDDYEIIKKAVNRINDRIDEKGTQQEKDEKLTIEDLQSLYRRLQDFFSADETVNDIIENPKHKHLAQKTLYLDDVPLGKLEEGEIIVKNEKGEKVPVATVIPVSKMLHDIEGGRRDPYARMWGDTQAAFTTHEHLANAMTARDPDTLVKEINELAGPLTGYAGRPPFLKLATSVVGGWLDMAKADSLWGTLGLANKVPWATSEFERLFGLAAPSMTRDQLKGVYEKVKVIFGDFKKEPGGEELDKKIIDKLGIQDYKVALSALKMIAFLAIVAMLQEILKELEKEE